ncbi:MAG: uroporphyrinogen-III C-methyltransferase [Alteromonadaceae bacterium]|nr:uroporphyrinogen-III C-methyltransferase [Alteromonadaceae bacterium]
MRYFPIFFDTQDCNILVVGAGEVAARKIELLIKTEANVSVVSIEACDTVQQIANSGKISLTLREFQDGDLDGKDLAFVATDSEETNSQIQQIAKNKKVPVNVVDAPPLCDFITPSIVDRNPVTIAMSSGGSAPVLLRYLRERLESWIPENYSRLGKFAEFWRNKVKQSLPTVTQRRYFWESFFNGSLAEDVLQGKDVEDKFQQCLEDFANDKNNNEGQVYLIGAGPGDPELLTFKALRLMQKADVVVYDRLVSPEILDKVRRDAEKIYVGKAKSNHTLPQEDISQLLVDRALAGERVVLLKGGDPFIFGRGGEEIELLVKHKIGFQVVPGITAAAGAASYAGIPLTHRDHAQSVVFATGHLKDNSIDLDWPALVQKNQTTVFYMGLTGLTIICEQLQKHGMPSDSHIAIVENATSEKQRVVTGTLESIVDKAQVAEIRPPSLIIVGSVVSLHESLNWFNHS